MGIDSPVQLLSLAPGSTDALRKLTPHHVSRYQSVNIIMNGCDTIAGVLFCLSSSINYGVFIAAGMFNCWAIDFAKGDLYMSGAPWSLK